MPVRLPIPDNISESAALDDTPIRVEVPPANYPPTPKASPALRSADSAWVERTLREMTLEEKVGQLFISTAHAEGEELIDRFHIGGFVFMGNDQRAADIVAAVNRLQRHSPRALWFSTDSESGLGARCGDATIFPTLMAFGAAGDEELAELCGRITARESRALGLHVTFGPVVDVNTENRNPIIATRSYSDRVNLVHDMAKAHIEGTRAEGVLCTLKHYPGHGASAGDSHHSLPTIDLDLETLQRVHLAPYARLVKEGEVDLIMTAHLWFPQMEPGRPWPATLSALFNQTILREQMGFEGILVSDAFDMVGLTSAVPDARERGVLGLERGLDVILGVAPSEMEPTWQGIIDAVRSGRLSEGRIDLSVRRILAAKSRAGLPEERFVDEQLWRSVLNHPEHRAIVRRVCQKAFTQVKNSLGSGPILQRGQRTLVLTLAGSQRIFYRFPASLFTDPLKEALGDDLEVVRVPQSMPEESIKALVDDAAGFDRILVAGYDWSRINSEAQVTLVNRLCEGSAPVIYVGFGAPYHLKQIPHVDACYCGYASVRAMQETAAEVLLGQRTAEGRLPVTL